MIIGVALQQPSDNLFYDVSYTQWLDGDTDTLDLVTVAVTPSDSAVSASVVQVDGENIKVWVSGGAAGDEATVEINAGFTSGRDKQDEILVRIREF